MDKEIASRLISIRYLVLPYLLSIFLGFFVVIFVNEGYANLIFLILIFTTIVLIIGILLIIKTKIFSITNLLLGIYVFLFSIGRTSIGRLDVFNREVPIHLALLPIIIFLPMIRLSFGESKLFWRKNLLKKEFLYSVLLFMTVFLSIFMANNRKDAILATAELSSYLLVYYAFSILVTNFHLWLKLIWVYLISTTIILINSIYHFYFSPYHFARLVASDSDAPNQYALTLEFGFFIFFGLLFSENKSIKSVLYAFMVTLFGYGIFLTFSRGAWLSVFVGAIIFLILSIEFKSVRIQLPKVFIGLVIMLTISFGGLLNSRDLMDRLYSTINIFKNRIVYSTIERDIILDSTIERIIDSPLLGIGLGQEIGDKFSQNSDPRNAHNSYLGIWVGSGVISVIFFMLFLFQHGANLFRIRQSMNINVLWGNIIIATYLTFIVHMLFQNFIFDSFFWGVIALQGAAINVYSISKSSGR